MNCPICKLADVKEVTSNRDLFIIECKRCGHFEISGSAKEIAAQREPDFQLSAWIRNQQSNSSDGPRIFSHNLQEIVEGLPQYRVSEKRLLFLRALERMTPYAGALVAIDPEYDFPLGWCKSPQELWFIITDLEDRKLIQRSTRNGSTQHFLIASNGWAYLEETNKPSILSNQAFVAMSFHSELDQAWKIGIKPAIERAGFQAYRVDASPHIEQIDMKIISEIKNSRFVIADVTQQRPGVYFEAGFAIGLGLPVFWSVRHDDLKNTHFDTRQYNHIVWNDEHQLAEKLYEFITAIVGKGSVTH